MNCFVFVFVFFPNFFCLLKYRGFHAEKQGVSLMLSLGLLTAKQRILKYLNYQMDFFSFFCFGNFLLFKFGEFIYLTGIKLVSLLAVFFKNIFKLLLHFFQRLKLQVLYLCILVSSTQNSYFDLSGFFVSQCIFDYFCSIFMNLHQFSFILLAVKHLKAAIACAYSRVFQKRVAMFTLFVMRDNMQVCKR